ncbi:MAG TPA: HlyD family type I secretion periplasmic adaptor subunit [Accumulibacter sp.]|uniref:HlyD family type I secretion periplasmic adaptor subunit n=1 Tax=Accumulibacter sp. TaxID=2053492 RepID=UPI0025D80C0C|nr:HlyD family type I secretion periplasmic adaptor subunit [Accumulibacter sp.]MCM8599578.1 HlyD family type I secretion periplasmic adaptor subunit [Accumulibacter sp.]MCM8663481.1 HlyD family type I secretion periplasmic adaptor subunit [Accumulibacter sp.]HNC51001.1 HlyD family type I secretion periplasmic adaptor subunit [Accumulibacter sp.]
MAIKLFRRKSTADDITDVSDVSERKPALPGVDINHERASRIGWLVLAVGFGGFLLWAALAPLDQGVPANGQVVVTGNRKTVQNLGAGLVQAIFVKDGDEVRSGDILVRLDPTNARSQYEMAHGQWLATKAAEARLLAEAQGRSEIDFPDELLKEREDPRAASAMALQTQLLRSRQAGLKAELGALNNTLAGLQSSAKGIEESKRAKEEQARLLLEELKGLRDLAADGYLPRNRLSEQERLLAQLNGAISEDLGNLGRTRQSIGETRMRLVARQQEYDKEVEKDLVDAQKEVSSLDSRLKGLAFDLANTEVRAPSEGIIVGLNVHTVGGVLAQGTQLMDVVPKNEPLRIDVQIPTTLIDKVKLASPVEITFPAFNQKTTPQIPGEFVQVAADATTDPQGKIPPHYRGQVVVTADGMQKLKTHEIKAGMPAEVFIKTGERTLLNYLFKPLMDRWKSALTEE